MAYMTPGVFVEEISTFPPSVVAVETAVPAFIGYTEKAEEPDGTTLARVPKRIRSLLEFERFFGGAFSPSAYRVQIDVANDNAIGDVVPLSDANEARRYYLYESVRHYFANGGGPCFVVSVGSYPAQPALGNQTTGLRGGLTPVRSLDEPTLLLFPDAVNLTSAELGSLQQAALNQCAELQDRFTIMDLQTGNAPPAVGSDPAQSFRQNVGTSNLRYGAAYYPWIRTIYRKPVRFRELTLVDASNVALTASQIDGLSDASEKTLVDAVSAANKSVDAVFDAVDVSGWQASPVSLKRSNFTAMQSHYAALVGAIHELPAPLVQADLISRFANLVLLPRALALSLKTIEGTANLPPEIANAVAALKVQPAVPTAIAGLIALEKHNAVRPLVAAGRTVADVNNDYSSLNTTGWIAPHADANAISPSGVSLSGSDDREKAIKAAGAIAPHFTTLATAVVSLFEAAEHLATGAEAQLFASHEVMKAVKESVQAAMSLLPPSGGVAGVYSTVDRTRGVWKAPANVSLADTLGPTVKVNDRTQERLNVHSSGKSVNALRAFTDMGTLVWGSRTLAGNDNEWRYVNVRRFFNMAEESIKKASEPFTFEPNDANTWIRVKAMIENFLTVQWRQGALIGSTPQKAFYVKIGLGETMTAEDILEGLMIIEIGMAVVRPAEFIILKFSHKMQVS